jgi:hypothetical protein
LRQVPDFQYAHAMVTWYKSVSSAGENSSSFQKGMQIFYRGTRYLQGSVSCMDVPSLALGHFPGRAQSTFSQFWA